MNIQFATVSNLPRSTPNKPVYTNKLRQRTPEKRKGIDWLPYPAGCLVSAAMKEQDITDRFNFNEIWFERNHPSEYKDDFSNIDMLCLTNFQWNQTYNDALAKSYKEGNPKGKVIYGGNNVPENQDIAEEYIKERPFLDMCFVGQSEGNFINFLKNYDDDWSKQEGSFGKDWFSVNPDKTNYITETMPTPYLDGVYDSILNKDRSRRYMAHLETNRGCPFRCAFCDWGSATRSKVVKYNEEKVYENIDWLWNPVNKICLVAVLDANFGLNERDITILEHIIKTKHRYNNRLTHIVLTGLVKNKTPYLETIYEMLYSEWKSFDYPSIKFGIQSHSPETLKTINRENIKNELLYPLFDSLTAKKLPVITEIILGLPGETKDSWLETLEIEQKLNVSETRIFTLEVIVNTPMNSKEFKEKNGLKIKKILMPLEYYTLDEKLIFDDPNYKSDCDFTDPYEYIEKVFVYECNSYTNEDLIDMYMYWWWWLIFYNIGLLREDITSHELKMSDQIKLFFSSLDTMPTLKKISEDHRNLLRKVIGPEPVTKLSNYAEFLGTHEQNRTDELLVLYNNRDEVGKELKSIYPNVDTTKWTNPIEEGIV